MRFLLHSVIFRTFVDLSLTCNLYRPIFGFLSSLNHLIDLGAMGLIGQKGSSASSKLLSRSIETGQLTLSTVFDLTSRLFE